MPIDPNDMNQAPQPMSQPQPSESPNQANSEVAQQPASGGYSTNYKERIGQIKAQQQKAFADFKTSVITGIDEGKADPVAEGVYKVLYDLLCAPYDFLNYAIVTFMSLTPDARKKFVHTGWCISGIFMALFIVGFVMSGNTRYLVSVIACLIAFLVLYSIQDLKLSADINLDELVHEDLYL